MKITVIMPVYNGESTIEKTLVGLLVQSKKFDELIVIDDGSKDRSVERLKNFLDGRMDYNLIQNEKRLGLAAGYNRGIKSAKGDLIVTLHQDIILEKDSLEKLVEPFHDKKVVAASHIVSHPLEVWNKYNFWQKSFFGRLAGKDFSGIDGKFDAFRKSALEKAGLFDDKHFHTAGEDGDMVFKLKKMGKIADTEARIIHLHKVDPNFSWKDIVHKQAQYSEAQGVLLALGRIRNLETFGRSFFRELMLLALVVPYLNIVSLISIALYSFLYTKIIFEKNYKDKRIFILSLFNIFLLFVSSFYSLRGFIYGKQRI